MEKLNCWDFKRCGKNETNDCPAYPKAGRVCYLVAGTLCGGTVQGSYAQKIGNCKQCDFYRALVVEGTV